MTGPTKGPTMGPAMGLGAALPFAVVLALMTFPGAFPAAAAESAKVALEGGIAKAEPFPPTTAPNLAPVRIRVWPHESYGRIVFDWPAPVTYSAKSEGGKVVVSFARPFAAVLGRIRQRLSGYVSAAEFSADHKTVTLTLRGKYGLKSYANGGSVVVDLIRRKAPETKATRANTSGKKVAAKAKVAGGPGPRLRVRVGEHQDFSRFVFDWKRLVAYRVTKKGRRATISFKAPASLDLRTLRAKLPKFVSAMSTSLGANGLAISLTINDRARLRHFRAGTKVVVDVLRPQGQHKTAPASMAPPTPAPAAEKPAPVVKSPVVKSPVAPVAEVKDKAKPPSKRKIGKPLDLLSPRIKGITKTKPAAAPVPVTRLRNGDVIQLAFGWREEVGAAVFTRAGFLWVVFDKARKLDTSGLRGKRSKMIAGFDQRIVSGATVVRLPLANDVSPSVQRDGTAWVVEISSAAQPRLDTIPIEFQLSAIGGSRAMVKVADAGDSIKLTDPEVGDEFWVVPLTAAGRAVGVSRRLAQLEILATLQGIVVRPLADDVAIRTLANGIELTTETGLLLSSDGTRTGRRAAIIDAVEAAGKTREGHLFDIESWRREAMGPFTQIKQALQQAVIEASPTRRNAARLEFAQFYFAYGMVSDAYGLLQTIERDEPALVNDAPFRGLSGAVHYLLGNYRKAEPDLFHPSLDVEREANLWRAALAGIQGDWTAAAKYFSRSEAVLKAYPQPHRVVFGLLAAETALAIGEEGLALIHLDSLLEAPLDQSKLDQIAYLRGQLMAQTMNPDAAVESWDRAIQGVHPPSRVKAGLARVNILLEQAKITRADAIKSLEILRYSWRGGDFEFKLLRRLGELYIAEGDFKRGLMTYREAVTYFPNHLDSVVVARTMRVAFLKLYIEGAADKMPPLVALALYDEFRELTPAGDLGNRLITDLTNRLVQVDLLDRAATLLQHQIAFRVKGIENSRAQNQLALVYLFDRKPEKAFEILKNDLAKDSPPEDAIERRQLRARALGEMARYQSALVVLDGDTSREANLLRAEIYWRTQNWKETAKVYKQLVFSKLGIVVKVGKGEEEEIAGGSLAKREQAQKRARREEEADEKLAEELTRKKNQKQDPLANLDPDLDPGRKQAQKVAKGEVQGEAGPSTDQKIATAVAKGKLDDEDKSNVMQWAIALQLSNNADGLANLRRRFATQMATSIYKDAFQTITGRGTRAITNYRNITRKVAEVDQFEAFMISYRQRLLKPRKKLIN